MKQRFPSLFRNEVLPFTQAIILNLHYLLISAKVKYFFFLKHPASAPLFKNRGTGVQVHQMPFMYTPKTYGK